jgi:poly(3-hydroxybutyrate) depolymerase
MNAGIRRGLVRIVGSVALLAAASLAFAATPVPSGKWSFVFTDAKGRPDRPIRVYTYRPRQCDSTCPIQFVMHGALRNASAYRDEWESAADRHGFLVVAPEFSAASWKGDPAYSLGEVAEQENREKWAYSAIEHLFDEVRVGQSGYRIYGHAAGAQFVQRFMILRPDNRASAAAAAGAGGYLMPEWRAEKAGEKYPWSLVGAKVGAPELRTALSRRLIVLLGEKDTDPNDPDLTRDSASMKQGANRLDRGEAFFQAATAAAQELGVPLAWELSYVPTSANDGATVARAAGAAFYGAAQK